MLKNKKNIFRNEKGMVLVVGLLIIMVLTLLITTAVMTTTTDLKITGNYKTSEMAFYAAEAGIEEARERLRYNYLPDDGGLTSRIKEANDTERQSPSWSKTISATGTHRSIQSALSYEVTIEHQKNTSGAVLYWRDFNNDGLNERDPNFINEFKTPNIYKVTSTGYAAGAQKTITVEMTRLPPITAPAALYVEAVTTIQGSSTNVIGVDQCGGASLPGVVTTLAETTVTANGHPNVCGVSQPCTLADPWDVVGLGTNMDIQALVDQWKTSANSKYTYTGNKTDTGMAWGIPTLGATLQNPSTCSASNIVYYNMTGNTIKLSGGSSGCGILLVDGDLDINGGFNWNGMVIVAGSITYTGGGNKNITGAVLAGGSVDADLVGGNANIVYCSSAINKLTQNRPLKKLSWEESM
jgi:Tfp pilus assembly protein PilX